ncbi:MAG: hypothetical protein AAGU08_18385 [Sporomusa sphaeroides]
MMLQANAAKKINRWYLCSDTVDDTIHILAQMNKDSVNFLKDSGIRIILIDIPMSSCGTTGISDTFAPLSYCLP